MKNTYYTSKIVTCEEMTRLEYNKSRGWTMPENEDGDEIVFKVTYKDGYVSMCPKEKFLEDASNFEGAVDFDIAFKAMKEGYAIKLMHANDTYAIYNNVLCGMFIAFGNKCVLAYSNISSVEMMEKWVILDKSIADEIKDLAKDKV